MSGLSNQNYYQTRTTDVQNTETYFTNAFCNYTDTTTLIF